MAIAVRFQRLMRESESVVEATARSGSDEQRVIAQRLIAHPQSYLLWESRHAQLMRQVSLHRRPSDQRVALRWTALALIHRKALFEYLRDRHITGRARHRLFELFYGTRDYANAVVIEHTRFLRNASSFYCTSHIGAGLLGDAVFEGPLLDYEQQYNDYFRLFCESAVAGSTDTDSDAQRALVLYLKRCLGDARRIILGPSPSGFGPLRLRESARPS
ncbi:MAG TPA: hypothetical protein VMB48_04610 [Steroidobacteraceae bacterium]|nr:hypothetical protein [Steroidobacteraceae bacterium]